MFIYILDVTPRTRKTTAERRTEIAAAALRLLGRGGLSAVTSATVAAEIGVSPAALFRHFATLPEIVEAAVDLAVARLDASVPSRDEAPLTRLRTLAQARVRLFAQEPGVAWLLRSEQAYASLPESAVGKLRGAIARSRRFIHGAIHEGVELGSLRSDVSPRALLTVYTATIQALVSRAGLAQRSAARPDPDDVLGGLFRLISIPAKEVPR
jgi:AcrR family transcriptional regulator